MAAETAWREEGEHKWEQECLAAGARVRAKEEQRVCKEEESLAVERDLCKVEGPSRERAPWQWLFLPSLDSAGSLEEEEKVESPPRDKGKGRAPVQETDQGEVTEVICDLCDKKGIPCQ